MWWIACCWFLESLLSFVCCFDFYFLVMIVLIMFVGVSVVNGFGGLGGLFWSSSVIMLSLLCVLGMSVNSSWMFFVFVLMWWSCLK